MILPPYELVLAGEPTPKQRARVGKGHGYTPAKTKAAEDQIGWIMRHSHPGLAVDDDHFFAVELEFYFGTWRRKDYDNCVKLVLDALNGVVWQDDSQVISSQIKVVRGAEFPRTVLRIDYTTMPVDGKVLCRHCRQQLVTFWSPRHRRCCADLDCVGLATAAT